jgi:YD repeat-containing protein
MPLLFSFTYLHAATFTNTYDPLNRLTNAAYSDGSRESYSYDKSGNRTVRITSAATIKLDSTPPSVPTNLVSLTYTPSQLSVGWSRSFDMGGSGLAGYSVFVNGVLATNTTDTTFTLSNYFPGLNYCITVIAADRYTNTSLPSVPLCYATQATNDLLSPLLTITSPANNAVLHTNRTPISGTVTDASRGNNGIASLTINAASVAGGSATLNATSYWSAVYSLRPGWNAFEIVARDASIAQNSSTSRLDLLSVPSTNEPPAFASFGPGTQGGVAMQLVSETNLTVEIWASTNLKDWEFLTNVYFTNWLADWTDPAFASYSQRFYRLLRRSIWPPTLRLKQANHIPSRMPVALGDNGWFYGMRSNGVYAFDSQTLEPKWFFQFGSSCPVIASNAVSLAPGGGPVFFQNDFYSSDCTNGLIALDPTNGAFLWRRTNGGLYARQVPSVNEVGSRVYFGSDPLSGLNYSTMAPFTFSISNSHVGSIGGQGLALDAQNNIYVGGHGPSSVVSSFGSSGAYRWSRTNVGSDHLRINDHSTLFYKPIVCVEFSDWNR